MIGGIMFDRLWMVVTAVGLVLAGALAVRLSLGRHRSFKDV